jgi:hypothetical protein
VNRLAQEAVLAGLARRLDERGSWSGETHLQKAAYLLHELTDVPFEFEFILYKHGPFSFELRDELSAMRADRLLERQPQPAPMGHASLLPNAAANSNSGSRARWSATGQGSSGSPTVSVPRTCSTSNGSRPRSGSPASIPAATKRHAQTS